MVFMIILILPLYILCLLLHNSRKTPVIKHIIYAIILSFLYSVILFITLFPLGLTGISDMEYDVSLFIPAQLFIPLPYILMIIKANTLSKDKGIVINIYISLATYFAALVLFFNADFFFNLYIWTFIYTFIFLFTFWFIQHLFPQYRISNLMILAANNQTNSLNIYILYFLATSFIILMNEYTSSLFTKGILQISYFIIPYVFCLFLWLLKNSGERKVNVILFSSMVTILIVIHHYFILNIRLLEYNSIFIILLIPIPYILILIRSKNSSHRQKTAYTIFIIPFAITAFTASLMALQILPLIIILLIYTPFFIRKHYG